MAHFAPRYAVGQKTQGVGPEEAQSSTGSDSGNVTGSGTHKHSHFWSDNVAIVDTLFLYQCTKTQTMNSTKTTITTFTLL